MAIGNYIVKQIKSIVNDAYEDVVGKSNAIQSLNTTDLVSMGNTLDQMQLFDGWFGALANRIVKTVFFIRFYDGKRSRSILRDEHEYGAFIQKVYTIMPEVDDNPEYKIPETTYNTYTQSSPYDVKNTVQVTAKVYGGQGTFALEFVQPIDQVRTAFTNNVKMQQLIDSMFTTAMNKVKAAEEALISMACNTAMAACINNDLARNLLEEYNDLHEDETGFTALTVANCMYDADFCKYITMEIGETIEDMQQLSTVYNAQAYETFTDRDQLVCEMITKVKKFLEVYLQSDTFNESLVDLKGFELVNRWAYRNKAVKPDFESITSIDVIHDEFKSETNLTGEIKQSGIIAFVHDIEYVAAYFGHDRDWQHYNSRDDVMAVGFNRRKGYAVDDHANAIVFYIADPAT